MWLLSTTDLTLHSFVGKGPPYSILSHTWENEEVTHQEMLNLTNEVRRKAGYRKISACAARSLDMGFEYTWVDTCCIDKSSSAELSEAINSMFKWYEDAAMCLVYLRDYHPRSSPPSMWDIGHSRWFTRGWTLQEIIAPRKATFYTADWRVIGTKADGMEALAKFLSVNQPYLQRRSYIKASVATKMSWAAKRQTTRPEDMAYCLMGLFDVNMPLLYGEGPKAFMRLQEEIIKRSDDTSIFMWRGPDDGSCAFRGPLAVSPEDFAKTYLLDDEDFEEPITDEPYTMTNKGLRLTLPLCAVSDVDTEHVFESYRDRLAKIKSEEGPYANKLFLAVLSQPDWVHQCAWLIRSLDLGGRQFARFYPGTLFLLRRQPSDTLLFKTETIYMKQNPDLAPGPVTAMLPFQEYWFTIPYEVEDSGAEVIPEDGFHLRMTAFLADTGVFGNKEPYTCHIENGAIIGAARWVGIAITLTDPTTDIVCRHIWLFVRFHAKDWSMECVIADGAMKEKMHQLEDINQVGSLINKESHIVCFEAGYGNMDEYHEMSSFGTSDASVWARVVWKRILFAGTIRMRIFPEFQLRQRSGRKADP